MLIMKYGLYLTLYNYLHPIATTRWQDNEDLGIAEEFVIKYMYFLINDILEFRLMES